MEDIRGVRLRKFKLRKIILGVRMHIRHRCTSVYALQAGEFQWVIIESAFVSIALSSSCDDEKNRDLEI